MRNALLRELGLQLVAVECVGGERRWNVDVIQFLLQKREPDRLRLFDDRDLDPTDLRHLLAFHRRDQRLIPGLVARLKIPDEPAVIGIGLEDDLRAPGPALQNVRARTDRMRHELFAGIGVDDFARHGAKWNVRNDIREIVVGSEENPLAQLEDVGRALVGDFGHGFGRHRHELRRSRQIIVSEQALEDRFVDRVRVQVGDAARIESRLAGRKIPANDFGRIGLGECSAAWRQNDREH